MSTTTTTPHTFPYIFSMDEKDLTIHQDPAGEWRAGIGAVIWDAALCFSRYFILNKPLANEPKKWVVELGAGTGLVSVVLANIGGYNIISTDQKCALPLLQFNCKTNVWDVLRKKHSHVIVEPLTWGENKDIERIKTILYDNNNNRTYPDLLVVSDCVYWPELFDQLITSIVELCDEDTELYLSYESRKKEQENIFFTKLNQYFDTTEVPKEDQDQEYQCPEIFILKGKLKKKI